MVADVDYGCAIKGTNKTSCSNQLVNQTINRLYIRMNALPLHDGQLDT